MTEHPTPGFPVEAETAAADPGNFLGKYLCVSLLGSGGMGEVWKAWDTELRRWAALKFLKHDDPEELTRFKREARTAAVLNHPNIASVYEVGELGGRHFIAMQLVSGQTLAKFPRKDRRLLVRLLRDAALAVHAAHERQVVHRDLKPENLMVENERVFVLDFGLAKQTSVGSSVTLSGTLLGTPMYMSPEQARGRELDRRSDVWSLGATLYDLLTGGPPFQAQDMYETLSKVIDQDPIPVRSIDPTVDGDLETITMKCLEKNPARRFPTSQALAEELTRWLEGEAILSHPPSTAYRVRKFLARRKAVVIPTAAALLLGLAFATWAVIGAITRRLEIDANLDQAERLENEGKLDEAKAKFTSVKDRDPGNIRAVLGETRVDNRLLARRLDEKANWDKARGWIDLGRRSLEQMRLRMRDPAHTRDELRLLAEEADRRFRRAFERVPDHPEALVGIARAWALAGDRDRALESLDRAIRIHSGFGTAYLDRVRLLIDEYESYRHQEDNPRVLPPEVARMEEQIRDDLRMAKKHATDDSELIYAEALEAFGEDRYEDTIRLLDRYIVIAPEDPDPYYWRGHTLMHLDRFDEAVAEFGRALARNTRGDGAWRNRSHALRYKGERLYWRGETDAALAALDASRADAERTLALRPDQPPGLVARALATMLSGEILMKRGEREKAVAAWDAAIADWSRIAALIPREPGSHVQCALLCHMKGDLDAALRHLETALRIDDRCGPAYGQRGEIHRERKRYDEAVADLTRAVDLDPANPRIRSNRGLALAAVRDFARAIDDCTRGIELNPLNPELVFNRGYVFHSMNRLDDALADYDRALAMNPRLADVYVNRGNLRTIKKESKAALADYDKAIECHPRHARAYYNRGLLRQRNNEFDDALRDFGNAIESDPKYPEPYFGRGNVHKAKGEWSVAIDAYTKAIELRPEWGVVY